MKLLENIDNAFAAWLMEQHIFFVATAPLSQEGHVNCSPKGGDCFRVFGPMEVGYLDYTGSGAETAAHLRENGRIALMFCAFVGKPNIVRLHGTGEVIQSDDHRFAQLSEHFPPNAGARAIIKIVVERVSTSCGFSVPFMDFKQHRDTLDRWAENKGEDALQDYRKQKNSISIDGLPAILSE